MYTIRDLHTPGGGQEVVVLPGKIVEGVLAVDVSACTYSQRRLLVSERRWQFEQAQRRTETDTSLWAIGAG